MFRYFTFTAFVALAAATETVPHYLVANSTDVFRHPSRDSSPLSASPAAHVIPGSFQEVGKSGVPAMHAALLQDGTVMFLDKIETYTEMKLENGRYAYSSLYHPGSGRLVPLSVRSNAFCSAGAFLADGRLLNVSGNSDLHWLDPTVDDGLDAIRYLDLSNIGQGWLEPGNKLSSKRWYASAQALADGSIFVASGSLNALDVLNKSNNNPTYEVLDRFGRSDGKSIMYPFLHLLKNGMLFVFVSKSSEIFNVSSGRTISRMPDMEGLYRTYPNTGGSVMLPLSNANNHEPTIIICGGGGWQDLHSPSDPSCGLIEPMSDKPQWTYTSMPEGRCMVEGILLLDGTVLWINGAQRGAQGFGIADTPALEALIFDPKTHSWTEAGTSTIARLYHSVALMLLDGTILIASSNPNEMPVPMKDVNIKNQYKMFPTEFRIEQWTPPYLMGRNAKQRPSSVRIDKMNLTSGEIFGIEFKISTDVKDVKVLLYQAGFVTHALHMGQVMVELDHVTTEIEANEDPGTHKVLVQIPNIALALGPYVVYVVVNGIPAIGQFISLVDEVGNSR